MVEYLRRRADRDGQGVVPVRASHQLLLPPHIPNLHRAPPRRQLLPASTFAFPAFQVCGDTVDGVGAQATGAADTSEGARLNCHLPQAC